MAQQKIYAIYEREFTPEDKFEISLIKQDKEEVWRNAIENNNGINHYGLVIWKSIFNKIEHRVVYTEEWCGCNEWCKRMNDFYGNETVVGLKKIIIPFGTPRDAPIWKERGKMCEQSMNYIIYMDGEEWEDR